MFDNPVFVVILLVIVAALGAAAGFFAGRAKGQDMARGAKESDLNEAKAQIEADRQGISELNAAVVQYRTQAEGLGQQLTYLKSQLAQAQRAEELRVERERRRAAEEAERRQAEMKDKPFSELSSVLFDHRGASIVGHILLDTLEEAGYSVDDFDAVGALTAAAVPLVSAMIQAAASRGEDLDGFVMDFVYPSIKGPSIAGKRVVLIDSWLSEKSYVQTSSLVTLRNGNELSLDFSVVENEGAKVLAVASLIGGVDMVDPTIKVINPVTSEESELPFVEVFKESELH